jgi:hypothetical protein
MRLPVSIASALAFVLALPLSERAAAACCGPIGFPTLERLVQTSPVVAQGTIRSSAGTSGGVIAVVKVTAVYRGDLKVGQEVTATGYFSPPTGAGGECLLSYNWDLDAPATRGLSFWPAHPAGNLFTMRLERISDGRQLADELRRSVAECDARGGPCLDTVRVPESAMLLTPVTARNTIPFILLAPADDRTESLGRRWAASADAQMRCIGLIALMSFRNDANIALAKSMLSDTSVISLVPFLSDAVPAGSGKWIRGRYAVRECAAGVLTEWGLEPGGVQLEGPALLYKPLRIALTRPIAALLICSGVGALGFAGALRLAGLARTSPSVLLLGAASGVSLLLVVAAACLCARSRQFTEEVTFSAGGGLHQLASYRGGVQYQRLARFAPCSPLQYGRFPVRSAPDFWSAEAVAPRWSRGGMGFLAATGTAPGPTDGTHAYHLLRVPWWFLATISLLAPARALWILAGTALRRRRGRCTWCGYDLRASPGVCPECGTGARR